MNVAPSRVRYIKLGEGGRWEKACIKDGVSRLGFDTAAPERYAQCLQGRWEDVYRSFVAEGKDAGTARRFSNEVRTFFEDDGTILWITFHADSLYWGLAEEAKPKPSPDLDGVTRAIRGGWRNTDLNGERLTKDKLSGALVKLTGYRGTSCDVDVSEYTVRRINGQKTPEVERAITILRELNVATIDLIRLLTPQDFELLVDLVFSASGWHRVGVVGKTQAAVDLDLILPSERSCRSSQERPQRSSPITSKGWASAPAIACSTCITPAPLPCRMARTV